MPSDIRSFFGGKTSAAIREKQTAKVDDQKRKRSSRKILDDSDDDESASERKKSTPKKGTPKKTQKKEFPKGQETTTADYFASSSKSNAAKSRPMMSKSPTKADTNGQLFTSKRKSTSYTAFHNDDEDFSEDDKDAGDDIFMADAKNGRKRKDDGYIEIDSDVDDLPKAKKLNVKAAPAARKKDEDVEMNDVDNDDDIMVRHNPAKNPETSRTGKKRKSVESFSEDEADNLDIPIKSVKGTSSKGSPARKRRAPTTKKIEPESAQIQAILDSIPEVRAPTPPPKDPDGKPFDWRKAGQGGGGNLGPPPGAGSREIPVGQENCLAGLTFVFTGLLESISREEGQELVKRYGGKVTTAPSSKTSYVVLGADAGPSKLRKIKDLSIRTINEEGLFELIRKLPANGGDGKAAEKNMEKKKIEQAQIRRDAEEMEKEDRRKVEEAEKAEEAQNHAVLKGSTASLPTVRKWPLTSQLWTSKYAPTQINQICGNKGQVEKIQTWLNGWPKAHKYQFQKKGADGLGGYRAIIIHGPPGIGKTTAAHLAAKLAGYDVLESNASDTRSKKLVESGLSEVLNNNSLRGYFAADGKPIDQKKKKIVLIMDEVDGMSSGDRGGVGALAKVCKKTDIPMILICNERKLPKMKPFDFVTFDIPFRRPSVEQVRSRIATICHREGLQLPMPVIDALIEGSNKDIRQIINMISTARLDQTAMDYDKGKSMSKAWEKHVVLKPWDICHKLLGSGMFAPSSKATLNDKIELYFNDHEFSFLMIQENYLGTKPILANGVQLSLKEQKLKLLQLADQAAESISDGDLVDRMIHGSQQQWSLMPVHAVFSAVRPASFVSGAMSGQSSFTQWLGNNSKTGKLTRYVKEIQSHMRLRSSGDRHEIRQQYLPVLWTQLVKRLEVEGKTCVDDVIDLMDSYFLTRDDFEYIMELGLGPQRQESVKLESQTKAAFTRSYNSRSHPLPFMKASSVMAPQKAVKVAPDLEEAFEEEDDGDVITEVKDDEEVDGDWTKDKYIKQAKVKKPVKGKKTDSKAKTGENDGEEFEDEDNNNGSGEEAKPKKARGKAKARSGRVKGKT